MSIPIYSFDGHWWYSLNGQLKPLPETVKSREEAKAEARKIMEPGSEGKKRMPPTFSFDERSIAPCNTNEGTMAVFVDSDRDERTVFIPNIGKGE